MSADEVYLMYVQSAQTFKWSAVQPRVGTDRLILAQNKGRVSNYTILVANPLREIRRQLNPDRNLAISQTYLKYY